MLVRELEAGLLRAFPAQAAESWDRTGMLVGNPSQEVSGVTVALDPSLDAIRQTAKQGDNVLVTHHPAFLDPPERFVPIAPDADVVGSRIYAAIEAGISIISFHTALDANPKAAAVLSAPLGLEAPFGLLEETPGFPDYGYGRLCRAGGVSVDELAHRCEQAFGKPNRVWGRGERAVDAVCLWTGAAGNSPRECNARGIDLLICGEVKYHEALDACEAGLAIIELGHDVSEQVHCRVLVESLREIGISVQDIHLLELPENWR